MKLYDELSTWWPIFSHADDYEEEAGFFVAAIQEHAKRPVKHVLELGSGGGNNASHMKTHFDMTLVDISPGMLGVSRDLNPELEHIEGDMRTVRLDRTFDAVFVHDAIMYMTTEDDLRAAIATAALHVAPGGLALYVPDWTTETFEQETSHGGHDADDRAIRFLEWDGPSHGTVVTTTYVYVFREGDREWIDHETHDVGLFPRATWLDLIAGAGLQPVPIPYNHSEFEEPREFFAGVRPT
ncbi:MAG: class I SAM-dependent methyltransferase [Actinomycetota bacterium]